jgi:hypothetical protein
MTDLREHVRERYALAATAADQGGCGCADDGGGCGNVACAGDEGAFGEALYSVAERDELPKAATLALLGCGNPTAVAGLREGETVLDLGSGGLEAVGFEQISVDFTHQVADGMHGAIVKAVKTSD